MSSCNRRHSVLFLSLLLLVGCSTTGGPQPEPLAFRYYRSGDRIGLMVSKRTLGSYILSSSFFTSDYHDVFVPLRGSRGPVRLVADGWATDGSNVWCGELRAVASARSFRVLGPPLFAVGNQVRYRCAVAGYRTAGSDAVIPFEASKLEVLGCHTVRYEGRVYMASPPGDSWDPTLLGKTIAFNELALPDPENFHCIPGQCAAWDRNYGYVLRPGHAEPLFAQKRTLPRGYRTSTGLSWRVEGNRVTYGGDVIDGADPDTFVMVNRGPCPYGVDSERVYFATSVVDGADRDSFVMLVSDSSANGCIAFDKHRQYRDGRPVAKGDKTTVALIERAKQRQIGSEQGLYVVGPGLPLFRIR